MTERPPQFKAYRFDSPEKVEKAVDNLFNQEPITPLTFQEQKILRTFFEINFAASSEQGHISREAYTDRVEKTVHTYLDNALQSKKPIKIIDFGAANAEFLGKLKQQYGDDVLAVATSLESYENHAPVDEYHIAAFELLPKKFEKRADVAVSHVAWQYSPLPHLALRNMAKTLNTGGKGVFHYGAEQMSTFLDALDVNNVLRPQLLEYYNQRLEELGYGQLLRDNIQQYSRVLLVEELKNLENEFNIKVLIETLKHGFEMKEIYPSELTPDFAYLHEVRISRKEHSELDSEEV